MRRLAASLPPLDRADRLIESRSGTCAARNREDYLRTRVDFKTETCRGKTPEEAFVPLVERIEEEIAKERAQTIRMRAARNSSQEQKQRSPAISSGATKTANKEPGRDQA